MTPAQQEAKQRAEVMLAYAEGKEIEIKRVYGGWKPLEGEPIWQWVSVDYRVKPAPTTRPWGSADVPPVCWLMRDIAGEQAAAFLVVEIRIGEDLIILSNGKVVWLGTTARPPHSHISEYVASTDLKTWKKPEVAV